LELEDKTPGEEKEEQEETVTASKSQPVDLNQVAVILNSNHAVKPCSSNQTSPEDDGDDEEEEDEGGAHDTITSLAGVKMLQKYRRQIRGPGGIIRRGSQDSAARLEDLFKEEPLLEEEEKAGLTDEETELEEGSAAGPTAAEDVFVPPDGGYGWLVTLGAFICLFWTAGLVKSYGVLFAEMIQKYPNDIRIASWIPAAMTTTALALAPVASALCQRLNCRVVTTIGSLLAFLGLSLSAFMPNLQCLFFTLGILTGAGIGLSTTPGIVLTARYFDKRRSRANAFCLSGTAAGSFTLPILIQNLLSVYGFEGTLLILGACMLHVIISAALYRPLAVHVIIQRNAALKAAAAAVPITVEEEPSTTMETLDKDVRRRESRELRKDEERRMSGKDDDEYTALSSSCPQTGFIENGRFRHNSDEMNQPLSTKFRFIDQSFDTISMMSSVSNRSGEQDRYPDIEAGCHERPDSWVRGSRPGSWSRDHRPGSCTSEHGAGGNGGSTWKQHGDKWHHRRYLRTNSDNISTAKSLSLRELAFHQIGSHLNLYKTMMLGNNNNNEATTTGNTQGGAEAAAVKEDTGKSRLSFMFSCEDIMVDSTSVLKDSRHPSHTHLGGRETHRSVKLNRTQSAVDSNRKTPCRQRFYSESERDPAFNKHSSFCNLTHRDNKISLIGSTELVADLDKQTKKFTVQPSAVSESTKPMSSDRVSVKSVTSSAGCLGSCLSNYLDISLCADPVFLLLAGSVMMMAVGMPHCLFFLPTYAESVGISSSDASLLLSVSAIFDLGGRLIFGFILDLDLFPKYIAYATMIFLAGLSAVLLPAATTFLEVSVVMACYGIGTGSWFLMVPLLLAEQLGVERIASSYGLVRLFQSLTNLSGPMISGYIFSRTGSLVPCFYFMGSCMLAGGIIIVFLPLALKRQAKK